MGNFFAQRFGSGEFIGETLWIGHLGHFFILLSFFSSLLAAISYFFAETHSDEKKKNSSRIVGRIAFFIHGFSLISIFSLLFYMIFNNHFEYYYAWRHSSTKLPVKYIISCFWEGQEGSFLLWQFWHFVLGSILIFSAKKWESPVMSLLALAQAVIGSMLLGVYIHGFSFLWFSVNTHKIGVNPFLLLRNVMTEAPIFQRPEYLSLVKDGNGLNALLQNYWMVIHPPVLFLGFASTAIPFVYAIAGLWRKDYGSWINKALPWTIFSVSVLGTGIIMGGAWAYESLSFGGFWAWDPVENASLVPWLLIVAGLHAMLIYRNTRHSINMVFIFTILAFLLVLYSTFLTRSGVLGESSVHSFTDEGLGWQLVFMVAVFAVPALILYLIRVRKIPSEKKEEEFFSREFWMFIGALLLMVSAALITFTTSIPVWNKVIVDPLFHKKLASPTDPAHHYNNSQVWIAILVAIMTAFIQYLGYRNSNGKGIIWLAVSLGLSLLIGGLSVYFQEINAFQYAILAVCAWFALIANFIYIFSHMRGKILQSGGSIAHIGFALMLVGIVISQYKQRVISTNLERIDYGQGFKEKDNADNRLLIQGYPVMMENYKVTYQDKREEDGKTFFNVKYELLNADSTVKESFALEPHMQANGMGGEMVSNPATQHYLNRDIFTNVSSFSSEKMKIGTAEFDTLAKGDTIFTSKHFIRFDSLVVNPISDSFQYEKGIIAIGAALTVQDLNAKVYHGMPVYVIDMANDNQVSAYRYNNWDAGLSVNIERILPLENKVILSHTDIKKPDDFIIMRAIVFPYINLLWLGAVIMVGGGLIAMIRRIMENLRSKSDA